MSTSGPLYHTVQRIVQVACASRCVAPKSEQISLNEIAPDVTETRILKLRIGQDVILQYMKETRLKFTLCIYK